MIGARKNHCLWRFWIETKIERGEHQKLKSKQRAKSNSGTVVLAAEQRSKIKRWLTKWEASDSVSWFKSRTKDVGRRAKLIGEIRMRLEMNQKIWVLTWNASLTLLFVLALVSMKPQFFICLAMMSFTYSWLTSRVVSSSALLPTKMIGMFVLSSVCESCLLGKMRKRRRKRRRKRERKRMRMKRQMEGNRKGKWLARDG